MLEEDEVWHLGDFMSQGWRLRRVAFEVERAKHLIIENNDPPSTTNKCGLILCHYAFRTWNQMGKKSIELHGHSHGG